MDVYETENSRDDIDLVGLRYRRTPLPTGMVHEDSPRLKYGEWLPLKNIPEPVTLRSEPFSAPELGLVQLHIMHESSTYGILTSRIIHMSLGVDVSE